MGPVLKWAHSHSCYFLVELNPSHCQKLKQWSTTVSSVVQVLPQINSDIDYSSVLKQKVIQSNSFRWYDSTLYTKTEAFIWLSVIQSS